MKKLIGLLIIVSAFGVLMTGCQGDAGADAPADTTAATTGQ
jgi:hypothetical protein